MSAKILVTGGAGFIGATVVLELLDRGDAISLLEAARRHDVRRFVFAASTAVVGGHPPPAHVSLRFANAYGSWSAHKSSVVSAFVKAYVGGGPLVIRGTGEQTRDFVHVSDVTGFVLACLDAPAVMVASQIFQVGTGQETSLLEFAHGLLEVGGAGVPIEHEAPAYTSRISLREGLAQTLEWFSANRGA